MTRKHIAAAVGVATLAAASLAAPSARGLPDLAGRWTLNRGASRISPDAGFGMDLVSGAGVGSESAGGGRGGGIGGGGVNRGSVVRESEDDVKRTAQLVGEARDPSPHLTIVQTADAVTITDERGRPRTLHPDGREELIPLDGVEVATTSRWEAAGLLVRYRAEQNRELVYTYSRRLDPPQLVVRVQFVERGGHDTATFVYEPTRAGEPPVPKPAAPAPSRPAAAAPAPPLPAPLGAPPAGAARASDFGRAAAPAAPQPLPEPLVAGGPDAELKGLNQLGVVVEDLGGQAAACGLSRAPIEAAVTKSLTDAGLKASRNGDEDTYVYVLVIATSLSNGLCVSRYDVFLYTNTTATLSYQARPALVQVSLLHKGGLAGGSPASNAGAVLSGIKQYADEFASRIRAANR